MARTQVNTKQVSSVQRNDLDAATTGEAVVRKIVQGTDILLTSDGADAGTGDVTVNAGANVITTTNTKTLTNKRNQKRVSSTATGATLTPEIDTADIYVRTAQDAALTIANHSTSTMVEGEMIQIKLKDNGIARAISLGTNYRAMELTLPTTTVVSKWLILLFQWDATDSKFNLIGKLQQA